MNPITEGLTISALGLIITFSALGIFILIIVSLQRIFPYKPQEESPAPESVEPAAAVVSTENEEEITAAAIAVALAMTKQKTGSPLLGAALNETRSGWWNVNRTPARQSRDLVKS